MATSVYIDNTKVTGSSSMGSVNTNSSNTINVKITGLGNPFKTTYYKKWGISCSALASDGTTTAPNRIIYEVSATSSGTEYQVSANINDSTFAQACVSYGGSGSNEFYIWVQTQQSQYYYVGTGSFYLTYWYLQSTINYTSGYRAPDDWLSESYSSRSSYQFIAIKFTSLVAANYYFKAYTSSTDIILNYLGTGSSIPSFDIDKNGYSSSYVDQASAGYEEKYEFTGSANTNYWFAITGYQGAQFRSSYYLATRTWGQDTPSTEPFYEINGNKTDTYSLAQCTTVRYKLKVNNAGPVAISSYGTGAMAKVTSGTGTVDKTSGFYESGIIASDTSSGGLSLSFTATAGTTYYLWVRTYTYDDDGSITITVAPTSGGRVYIDTTGSGFEEYSIYIDNGSSWDEYVAYIDNGSSWDEY